MRYDGTIRNSVRGLPLFCRDNLPLWQLTNEIKRYCETYFRSKLSSDPLMITIEPTKFIGDSLDDNLLISKKELNLPF